MAKKGAGGWRRFSSPQTLHKTAAPRFVVFEAWAFLLPSLGDFLGCTRPLPPLSPKKWATLELFHRFISPNVHITVTEIFIPSILRA